MRSSTGIFSGELGFGPGGRWHTLLFSWGAKIGTMQQALPSTVSSWGPLHVFFFFSVR
ncbi:hypothetical protein MPNT_230008 [Candidatus Methylacidithermus pantelleriae]|uniref:Uncharacterized protein n=1 Tax=Candidatus Methylacidithermus pantelleriae TaxID=2744239 RepID=A0A8J2BTF3_9BACT|nr:hypothetical protein MPNT_230008 [Candidatus Methylacidithermus pantelleriae]